MLAQILPTGELMSRTTKTLGALAAAVAIAGVGYWWHWTGEPEYSMQRIAQALVTHDVTEFQRLVDLSSVASRAVDDIMGSDLEESGPMGQMVKPTLVQGITDAMKKAVERGAPSTDRTLTGNDRVQGLLQRLVDNFEGVKYIKREGKIAHVGLKTRVPRLGVEQTLDVMLREMDHYWQVADISNLKQYMAETEMIEAEMLDAINKERLFAVALAQKESWGEGNKRVVRIHAQVKNSYRTVTNARGALILSTGGLELIRLAIKTDKPWEKGETREWTWYPDVTPGIDEQTEFLVKASELNGVLSMSEIDGQDGISLRAPRQPLDPKEEQGIEANFPKAP